MISIGSCLGEGSRDVLGVAVGVGSGIVMVAFSQGGWDAKTVRKTKITCFLLVYAQRYYDHTRFLGNIWAIRNALQKEIHRGTHRLPHGKTTTRRAQKRLRVEQGQKGSTRERAKGPGRGPKQGAYPGFKRLNKTHRFVGFTKDDFAHAQIVDLGKGLTTTP